ncbi:hypothetical protein C8Q77DRAFT_913380 [Trametes polyzona]|nr:hypothetical protein C8Q77DRAFT_913380 [Trametes polyzona]
MSKTLSSQPHQSSVSVSPVRECAHKVCARTLDRRSSRCSCSRRRHHQIISRVSRLYRGIAPSASTMRLLGAPPVEEIHTPARLEDIEPWAGTSTVGGGGLNTQARALGGSMQPGCSSRRAGDGNVLAQSSANPRLAHPRSFFCCAEPYTAEKPTPLLPLLAPAPAIGPEHLSTPRSVQKVIARMLSCSLVSCHLYKQDAQNAKPRQPQPSALRFTHAARPASSCGR